MTAREPGPLPDPASHGHSDDDLAGIAYYTADQMRAYAAQEVAAERERRHALTVAFRRLDDHGFIQSFDDEGDAECWHWLSIAREAIDD